MRSALVTEGGRPRVSRSFNYRSFEGRQAGIRTLLFRVDRKESPAESYGYLSDDLARTQALNTSNHRTPPSRSHYSAVISARR